MEGFALIISTIIWFLLPDKKKKKRKSPILPTKKRITDYVK